MNRYVLSIFLLVSMTLSLMANEKIIDGQLHEVQPKSGDGVYTLLSRYELHKQAIYTEAFVQINGLTRNDQLFKHKKYKLPVFLYNYNGQSIRSTIGIDDWDKAVRIQKYNEELLRKGIRSTHYTASKILWVPFAEINDQPAPGPAIAQKETNTTPPSTSTVKKAPTKVAPAPATDASQKIVDLYGSKYASTEILSNSLSDQVFYIVSGHGGPDPGAMCSECSNELCEDEYAYDVSLRLARNLMQHGAKVEMVIQDKNDGIRDGRYLSCDKDERLSSGEVLPINQLKRLRQRTAYINRQFFKYKDQGYKDQIVISLHIDSNNKSHKQDVFFCYFKESKSSKSLAADLRDKFEEKYAIHQKNRKYKGYLDERNFYVLKYTHPEAVMIELANIKNQHNHKRILSSENRQALANWIFEGLEERYAKASSFASAK